MGYAVFVKDTMLTDFSTHALYMSLHTADPGIDGSNEVTTLGNVYERQAVTWNPASNGEITTSGVISFNVPGGGTTINFVGFWDDPTAGNWCGSTAVIPETYNSQGVYQVTALTADLSL